MEELKKLYEERQMTALWRACQKLEAEGKEEFAPVMYYACAEAARNNFSRLSLEHGIALCERAFSLAGSDAAKRRELFEAFTGEVMRAAAASEELLSQITMTPEITQSYRDCMRLSADALVLAVQREKGAAPAEAVSAAQKAALVCMVHLCETRRYEVDMGKNILKKTDHVSEELRGKYTALYDALLADIRKTEPDYAPEEIQRERPAAVPAKEDRPEDEPKKKGIVDRLLDFF